MMFKKMPRVETSQQPDADENTINRLIDKIYSAPSHLLVNSEYDANIEECLHYADSAKDREMLERLAFVLFHGPRSRKYVTNDRLTDASNALLVLFSDEKASTKDITYVLRTCFESWKLAMRSEQREFPQLNPATSDHVPWVFEGVNPEDEILITHAGGFHHINAFIKGKSIGYSLEQGGLGIQVNPTMATHAKCLDYAQRTNIINSLDSPAILIGTIKSKYLHRANNTYEAGLRTEHLEHLQNIRVFKLPFLWLGLQKAIDESIMIMGIHHNSTCPGLKSRLQKSYACLRQHSKENEIHWSRIYRAHYEEVKATLDSSTLKRLTSFTV